MRCLKLSCCTLSALGSAVQTALSRAVSHQENRCITKTWCSRTKLAQGCLCRHGDCRAGLNYLQSITPQLAAGGEIFWLSQQRKSGVGFSVRQAADKHVATAQVATTGLVSLGYLQKINEKVRSKLRHPFVAYV